MPVELVNEKRKKRKNSKTVTKKKGSKRLSVEQPMPVEKKSSKRKGSKKGSKKSSKQGSKKGSKK